MSAAIPFAVGGLGAFSALQEGGQQSNALNQQAAAERRNQMLLTAQARVARQQAGAEEEAQRRQSRQFLGTQRAAMGQSGVGFGGTPGMLYEDNAMQAELDALNIRYGGEQQAANLINQANEAGVSAQILKNNAKQARRSGYLKAGVSLLGGAASLFGSGGLFGKSGVNMQGQSTALTNNPAFVRNM